MGGFTIGSLTPAVIRKVENRVNDTNQVNEWIAEAITEITTNQQLRNDLVELEVTGTPFNLVIGQQEYAETLFLLSPSTDVQWATLDIMMWIDPPGNQIRIKLLPSHYQETDKFLVVNSLPVKWYRFGTNLGVYPIPNATYQVQARYLKRHPIKYAGTLDPPIVDPTTPILLNSSWNEIIKLSAAEKGFLELEEYEKADGIGKLLRGDPADRKASPGMLYGKKTRRESEAWREQQGLKPMIHAYTHYPRG